MPETPFLPADQVAEGQLSGQDAAVEAAASNGLPWWWFVLFLIMFVVFAVVVVVLVALGQNLAIAVGVPATLSAVALAALGRLAVLAHRREL